MTDRGVLLWIHGGGWRDRSDEDGAALAPLGLRVVPATYHFAAEAHWPAQLDDVRAAARAARAEAGGLPLLVGGDSAGAMLALHLGLRGVDRPGDVRAILAYWAPVDPLDPQWRGGGRPPPPPAGPPRPPPPPNAPPPPPAHPRRARGWGGAG
ncbi:alpha/beta hydrolase, partial [Micromonospora chersina]|uniref:alpha/beta hydrolase n=1 Tax=Micromonospora chersina TaxID=47854 RepID=UPI0033C09608